MSPALSLLSRWWSMTGRISLSEVGRRLRSRLPFRGTLPEYVWRQRHRFLVGLTWFHAVVIVLIGPVAGYSWELSLSAPFRGGTVLHTVGEGLIVAFFAASGGWRGASRTFQATAIAFGLMSSSAILVHLSGGYIELHFHFFVMLTFLALLQDWERRMAQVGPYAPLFQPAVPYASRSNVENVAYHSVWAVDFYPMRKT